jgi:acetylornithine deacetylase/succinyl-diaminopimelate desuccinylase-like protein
MKSLTVALALYCALPLAAQNSALAPHQRLAHEIYRQLIEINTADSVGSITRAAEALAERFRAAGFPAEDVRLLVPDGKPEKGNLVVRYRGRGQGKPILLLAHLDVVAALRSDWSLDPFVLTEKDGYFYGRGTSDDKAMAAIFVANLLRAKVAGWAPARDVVVALTADEEGGDANGVEWLLARHRELIDAALAINEGGSGALRDGKPFYLMVQAAEKVPVTFNLTVANRGGHSSQPRPDNAIFQLAEGLVRIRRYTFPVRLNPVSRAFFEATAPLEEPKTAAAMRAILKDPRDTSAARLLSATPRYNAFLRTTCTATRLAGGHAYNALPQSATASVNCRVLPGEPLDSVKETLARVVADTGIRITDLARVREPPPVPFMSAGATDGRFLRAAGVPTYGVSGLFGDPNDVRAHGRDERMLVKSFYDGQEFLYRLMVRLAGGDGGA